MPKGSEKLEMKILPHGKKELPANDGNIEGVNSLLLGIQLFV